MIEFLKTRDVNSPCRAHEDDAGIDFFVPKFDDSFREAYKKLNGCSFLNFITIPKGTIRLIPMGVYSKFNKGKALMFVNKSGVASKKKLILGPCLIDSGYQGELIVGLINAGNEEQKIQEGDKIVQAILIDIGLEQPVIKEGNSIEEFFNNKSERGNGGFGSTGN